MHGLQGRLLDLAGALRAAGVPVALSDDLDAVVALTVVDLLDRAQLREALAATMVKSPGHRTAFNTLFDLYFPARGGAVLLPPDAQTPRPRDIGDFLADLVQRVLAGDDDAIRAMAREAVDSFGRVDGSNGAPAFFQYRVFQQINLGGLLRRLLGEAGVDDDDPLTARLVRDDLDARLQDFRAEVDAEIRRRAAAARGADAVARTLVRPLPEDVDFFRVTADEQADMRRAVRPLARRMATRLAVKRRRARDGRLDPRRTMRHALSTGGIPIDPAFRSRHLHRPELVLLCDVSGSVAAFARFTLLFCHALQGQFSRVRSFAFIDTVDEVSRFFEDGDATTALRRMSEEANLVWLDGHSDYGNAFTTFVQRHSDAITPKTTLLVLGDARNNYRASGAEALAQLRKGARRTYWLNPEPASQWNSGDSVVREYARHVDVMAECRNLRQLAAFVETIA